MQIAVIAHEKKRELMTQFCIAYCGILSKHHICAEGTTGKHIADATGLDIECLMIKEHGGEQQIASRIAYNEIDVLLLFRDTSPEEMLNEIEINNLRLCDLYNIPVATNIATAEAIILALDRGDLDWRELVRNKPGVENQF